MKTLALFVLALIFQFEALGQSRSVLVDLSIQRVGPSPFEYHSSPLLPLGEGSTFPIQSKGNENLELQITPKIPKEAPGKNIFEFELKLSAANNGKSKVLSKPRVITRLHETVSISEKGENQDQTLFTITPVELQNLQ